MFSSISGEFYHFPEKSNALRLEFLKPGSQVGLEISSSLWDYTQREAVVLSAGVYGSFPGGLVSSTVISVLKKPIWSFPG